MEAKKCSKCEKIKPINEFCREKNGKDGYRTECKECRKQYCKQWREKHKEHCKQYEKQYYGDNKEHKKQYRKKWCKDNKELCKQYSRQWKKNNKDKVNKMCKKYRDTHPEERAITLLNWKLNNPEKAKEVKRKSCIKIRSTVKGKLDFRMGRSLRKALHATKNRKHWEDILGYDIEKLRLHLEFKFQKGMSWDKFINGEIHIDHIIPKSLFKYENYNDREFKQCWCLANLQPLWAIDNMSKGAKCD